MDQREITHACGHAQSHTLHGFGSQMDRKAAWLATTTCRRCYSAAKDAESIAATDRDLDAIDDLPLVPLTGSAGQIKWATTIRARRVATLRTTIAFDAPDTGAALLGIADAKWWIDHRDDTDVRLLGVIGMDLPQN